MSDESRSKRHLTLLPEVLPHPTLVATAANAPARATRVRTVDHMRKLLASAPVTSVALADCGSDSADKPGP